MAKEGFNKLDSYDSRKEAQQVIQRFRKNGYSVDLTISSTGGKKSYTIWVKKHK
jgi:hypothetical protein